MLIGLLLFMFIPRQLLSMFNASENMMNLGIQTLRIMSIGFLFSAISMIFYKTIGLTGIWITFPVSEIAAVLVCLWMFIRTCKNDEVFIKNND